ncbi:hypothetical protein KKG05_11905 [bacterium]|nr:hypothetical protein [bacterium]
MGMAKLNVWVRSIEHPFMPDSRLTWWIDIFVCNWKPLEWCDKTYYEIPTRCGHIEIDIPPGCYIVQARTASRGHHGYYSSITMVIAGCGETACVNLIPLPLSKYGVQYNTALEFQAMIGNIPKELAKKALEANKAVIEHLPKDVFQFEEEDLKEFMKRTEALEKRDDPKQEPPK